MPGPGQGLYLPPLTTAVDPGSGFLITHDIRNDGTWAWNGTEWFRPRGNCEELWPGCREGWLLADHAHGRLLLLGGFDSNWQPDPSIWAFEAGCWRLLTANSGFAMTRGEGGFAYDEARDRIVALSYRFGPGLAGTFEWDGTAWLPIATPVLPPSRSWFAMAYDAARQRTVVFGGEAAAGALGDIWEWDGVAWQQVLSATSPPPGVGILTFDPVGARCVLQPFGRHAWDGSIWSWNGATWSQLWDLSRFAGQLAVATFDPQRQSLYFYGRTLGTFVNSNELLEWDGARLWRRHGATMPPGRLVANSRRGALMAVTDWDPNVVWRRGANGWHARSAASTMPRRWEFGVACAPDRDRLVLFGGITEVPYALTDETFEWDGANWIALPCAIRPPARTRPGMAFDATTSEVLMFGGNDGLSELADTWSWNGVSWRQRASIAGPSARSDPAMAADPARAVVVLLGGVSSGLALGDTWEWDGGQWHLRNTGSSGGPWGGRLAFDAATQTMVGLARVRVPVWSNVWYLEYRVHAWDGSAWTYLPQPYPPQWSPWWGAGQAQWDGWDFAWDPAARSLVATDGLWGFTREVGEVRRLASTTGSWSWCAGTSRVMLTAERVYVGESTLLRFDAVGAQARGPVFLLAGSIVPQWNGLALPIDLTAQGATGCLLQVAPQFVGYVGTLAHGAVVSQWVVPDDPRLAGLAFDFQGVVLAPGVNVAGALLSDRLRLRIGQR